MQRISRDGLDFIKSFESFVPHVYDDKRPPIKGKYREWQGEPVRGTLTIGYGHTNAAKHPLKIKMGLKVTEREAEKILDVDLDDVEKQVNRVVKVPLTQGQFDALVSLSFNLGPLDKKAQTLMNRLNRKDYKGARAAFDLYVRSGGEVMRGLQRRRDGEQLLWDEEDPKLPITPVDHPAEVDPVNPKPMVTSKEGVALSVTGTLDTLHTAAEVSGVVSEVKRNTEDIGIGELLVAVISNPRVLTGVVVLIVVGLLFYWRWRKRQVEAPV